ncbi:YwmB family TATA-box binding protein [Clostridium ganghwense]|uniref:YwmB family TATA-box binding protein n=1 Tax=Clostridium ganghwense TaxID=312089 RepID=A0ABT4CLK7_9CLOT|nr:YwmB family TATA-box binding protein [Clostridium ganghwense]MCY6369813.1 YwmB family TATA-box binding protein [Clostridium ganghwense]
MEKNNKLIILLLIVCAMLLNYKISYAYKKIDIFNSILSETNGEIVEYGLKARFKTYKNGQESCNYFLDKININSTNYKIKGSKDKSNYCIEFSDESSKGYIEFLRGKDKNTVVIQILKKDNKNELLKLKNEIKDISSPISDDEIIYYQYLKAKLPCNNLDEMNKKIVYLLKNKGTENLHSIKINNGFSTSAYTKRYKPIKNKGKFMDLNFALCKYSSGNYIVIGTPEIVMSY